MPAQKKLGLDITSEKGEGRGRVYWVAKASDRKTSA